MPQPAHARAMADTTGLEAFPPGFVDRYAAVYGGEEELARQLHAPRRRAVRVNALRAPDPAGLLEELRDRGLVADPVPWWDRAAFLPPDATVGREPEHSLGYLYGMDAASLLPAMALGARPGEAVLDAAASPGSKTGVLAEQMANTGVLVANDANRGRAYMLISNLQRLGVLNAVVTVKDARQFPRDPALLGDAPGLHRVLVDAPCSNVGKASLEGGPPPAWSPDHVASFPALQRDLLHRGAELLAPGGVLVYSTCTVDPLEDEGVVAQLLADRDDLELEPHGLPLEGNPPVTDPGGLVEDAGGVAFEGAPLSRTLRLHPADHGTEGFFVARFRKRDGEVGASS